MKGMKNQYRQWLFPSTTDFTEVNLIIFFHSVPALEVCQN